MATQEGEDHELLQKVQKQTFQKLLPIIILVAFCGVIGFIGNLLAIIFYFTKTKRTSTILLIAHLAIADLIVCVLIVPNIIEMSVNVNYTEIVPCKMAHFVGIWTIACSILILATIAIDRHRKICRPFGRQMEISHVRYCVVGIVVFGFFLEFRNIFHFDITHVIVQTSDVNRNVTGYFCTTREDGKYKFVFLVFSAIDFLILLVIWVTLIVTYSHVVYTLYKLRKSEIGKHDQQNGEKPNNVDNGTAATSDNMDAADIIKNSLYKIPDSASPDTNVVKDMPQVSIKEHSDEDPVASETIASDYNTTEDDNGDFSNTGDSSGAGKDRRRSHHRRNPAMCAAERNISIMMLAVSVGFLVCFIPFFVVKILIRVVFNSGVEFELGIGAQFALRLPYMNSVFNPIIYCYFNPSFRQYLKSMFHVCFRRNYNIDNGE